MNRDMCVRRIQHLKSILTSSRISNSPYQFRHRLCIVRCRSSSTDGSHIVKIGDVSITVKSAANPHLVPSKYLPEPVPQNLMRHLRWIMQKDLLGQDVFLIGAPGPLRRNIAMMYLELTQKEAEYVSLSRDTTEMDLKQRREIKSHTALHVDQSAVRAAVEGRVLILEGIEKAERNVLPVLNNLLENREMQLDDGRFLMAADKYDKLLKDHSQAELDMCNLVRVSADFRVIALGIPIPRYHGNPLDPPLRSRFQARDVNSLPFKEQLDILTSLAPESSSARISQILSFATTLKSDEATSIGLPDFPLDNLPALIQILAAVPSSSLYHLLHRLYPHQVMLGTEGQTAVKNALKSFSLLEDGSIGGQVSAVERGPSIGDDKAAVILKRGKKKFALQVPAGRVTHAVRPDTKFVNTPYHDNLLADMMESHMVKDFCIIGPRGGGKSAVVKQFADMLGYNVEPVMLYQDMTARDLLQQRMTLPTGDTTWRPSALVGAALRGDLAVLDGVHRVNAGTFAVLQRLVHDRELTLFDGTRLLRHDRYQKIKDENGFSDEHMQAKGVWCIHPAFRIVALAEPPSGSGTSWLTSEQLSMFLYHHMRPLSIQEETTIIHNMVEGEVHIEPVMKIAHRLRQSNDANLQSLSESLSTRQLLRIARRLATYPDQSPYDIVQKACLARFLPKLTRSMLDEETKHLHTTKTTSARQMDQSFTTEIQNGILRIGNTETSVYEAENKLKIPDVVFYENPQHVLVMEDMLRDFLQGEHLLLVGNQGVGKNKLVDRFLQLLGRPREYLQLHRDTTVQTLTIQPSVRDGVIVHDDSPLVRAVRAGHVLIVDEADKAPTQVTCVLSSLVQTGDMQLADGRRIVSADSTVAPSDDVIVMHRDFRMVVLANRPGFPFLGNDFFGAMGDLFSAHAIDNPDFESEMQMLRCYAPSVSKDILSRLVLAFDELRNMADQGLITYPYSTREVVNMARHLERFPDEGLASVVRNVFDFDLHNREVTDSIINILHKHGIPLGADPHNVNLAKQFPMPKLQPSGQWLIQAENRSEHYAAETRKMRIKNPIKLAVKTFPLEKTEARSDSFSELDSFWNIPLHQSSVILDVCVTKGMRSVNSQLPKDVIHVITANPISLYSMDVRGQQISCVDLDSQFPSTRHYAFHPRIHLAALGEACGYNVVLHEVLSNVVLNVNWQSGEVHRIGSSTLLESTSEKISRNFRSQQEYFQICSQFSEGDEGLLLLYKQDSQVIEEVHLADGRCHCVSVPLKLSSVLMFSPTHWLLTESDSNRKYLLTKLDHSDYSLRLVDQHDVSLAELELSATEPLHDSLLHAALDQKITSPHRVLATRGSYAAIAVGLPDLSSVDIYTSPRPASSNDKGLSSTFQQFFSDSSEDRSINKDVVYLCDSGQIVRLVSTNQVPVDVLPEGGYSGVICAYLEVADLVNKQLRYIPVPAAASSALNWYRPSSSVVIATGSHDTVITVDSGGCVRLWETVPRRLIESLGRWRSLIGNADGGELQIIRDQDTGKVATGPKHGRIDPTGSPHVGGNTWAGGTGGRDTAGLGGIGGPYRLDAGHEVHQVSDREKAAVPDEVRQAAREMGQKAFKQRLQEIKMSEYDGQLYEEFASSVRAQVKSLRIILDSLQAKGKERQWLRNQSYGDLDETKLIEGITGERAIFKRRAEKEPQPGNLSEKPKILQIVCDVSGSMYRFNGHDGRLDRQMAAMLMVMEALDSYTNKIKYSISGHSGEGHGFVFVKPGEPPVNNKERLDVLKTLHAHSQYCISGDHTVQAAEHAIRTATAVDGDEHFVIVLSDANFDRYGISPRHFANQLTSNPAVNAYAVFIGSLGDQANRLVKQLPSGRAFVCMDTKTLPQILQQIFASSVLYSR